MHSLPFSVIRFLCKTFSKLLKFTLQNTLSGWCLKNSYIQIKHLHDHKNMRAGKQSELKRWGRQYRKNHTKQSKLFTSFNEWEHVCKKTKTKKRTFVGFITYSSEWKHFHWHWKFLLSYRPFFVALFFPIGLNIPLLFFANLFLLFYELRSIKNANYRIAKKIGNSFRFTNDLVAINDGNEFENLPMWTYFDTETFNETTKTETS